LFVWQFSALSVDAVAMPLADIINQLRPLNAMDDIPTVPKTDCSTVHVSPLSVEISRLPLLVVTIHLLLA
jgi:hypothetical protein